jgi:hypothetical protein
MRAVLALGLACLCLGAGDAHAQDAAGRAIAIASVEIAGDTTDELRAQIARAIADGLARGGVRVVALEQAVAAARADRELATCVTPSCLTRLTELIGVRELVRAHVSVSGDSYEVDLELLSPSADGGLAGRLQRSCGVCTVGELIDLLAGASADLATGAGAADRALAGPTAPDNQLVLAPSPVDSGETRPFRTWKWVAAGGAVAVVLTGVALLLADGSGSCDRQDAECPEVYDTRTAGIIGVTLGVLGGGASAWMFVADR